MSPIQRFFLALLPKAWAEDMRADSLRWMARCTCGHERSIWELGGIKWKGAGRSWTWLACPQCGRRARHTVYRKADG